MGLHLAVREQLSIDRPPGIRELHRQLQAPARDWHGAIMGSWRRLQKPCGKRSAAATRPMRGTI